MQIKSERKKTQWSWCVPPGGRRLLTSFSEVERDTTNRGARLYVLLPSSSRPFPSYDFSQSVIRITVGVSFIHLTANVHATVTITTKHGKVRNSSARQHQLLNWQRVLSARK